MCYGAESTKYYFESIKDVLHYIHHLPFTSVVAVAKKYSKNSVVTGVHNSIFTNIFIF